MTTRTLEEIRVRLEKWSAGGGSLWLDDMVHDICSNMGSAVNNGGITAQLNFISQHSGGEERTVKMLSEMIDNMTPEKEL